MAKNDVTEAAGAARERIYVELHPDAVAKLARIAAWQRRDVSGQIEVMVDGLWDSVWLEVKYFEDHRRPVEPLSRA